MNVSLGDLVNESLTDLRARHNLRSLTIHKGLVDFTSNDYLGLARSAELNAFIRQEAESIQPTNGSTGSRLLSGNSELAESLETYLANIFNSEATLLFPSGYMANLGVLSALPRRGDTIVMDEYAHASLKEGARLSHSRKWNFKHNDVADLEKKIKLASGTCWIVVESIYSMDGDQCPLEDIIAVAHRYGAHIILDEAHSTGVMGNSGSGLASSKGLEKEIDVRVHTFGKAMGVHGACVAGIKDLKEFLINFSRPFIYSTAPTDHSLISIRSAFQFLNQQLHLQDKLSTVTHSFLSLTDEMSLNFIPSVSQIQSILIPGNEKVRNVASDLQRSGFDVRPILSPTVQAGTERLRICLHSYNQIEELKGLLVNLHHLTNR